MTTNEEPIQIIANESNMVHTIDPGSNAAASKSGTSANQEAEIEDLAVNNVDTAPPQPSNDLANNDGSIIESLDTAFHGKPGTAEGINPSGSNRADYYEKHPNGQNDAQEELQS